MQKKIKQVYIPYWLWEDWKNGMWRKSKNKDEDYNKALILMKNHKIFSKYMGIVIKFWENTMINSLTNENINQKAFLGQCAVCYKLNVPNEITKTVWKSLNSKEKNLANKEAKKHISIWKNKYMNTLQNGKKDVTKNYQMKLQLK